MGSCEQCIIKQFNSLKALSKEELLSIFKKKKSIALKKGDVLFEEGEIINGIYCVKAGICKLSKLSANGKDQIIKLVVKGQLLGQRSLISGESSNLKAIALNDMRVCFIPKSEIISDLKNNPKFSLEVLKEMALDLKESDNIIVNMAQKSVRERLAGTLIYIHHSFGVNPDGSLGVILSREDFANIVGTATESVIRLISQFKKEGLITTIGKKIKIDDMVALKRVS